MNLDTPGTERKDNEFIINSLGWTGVKNRDKLPHRLDYTNNIELNTQSKAEDNDFEIKSKISHNEIIKKSIITYPEIGMEFFWKSVR